jgi:hypothetical protein
VRKIREYLYEINELIPGCYTFVFKDSDVISKKFLATLPKNFFNFDKNLKKKQFFMASMFFSSASLNCRKFLKKFN